MSSEKGAHGGELGSGGLGGWVGEELHALVDGICFGHQSAR